MHKTSILLIALVSACATHQAKDDALFSRVFGEVKRSLDTDFGGCIFANRDYDPAFIAKLRSPKSRVESWDYDHVDGRRVGLDIFLISEDQRHLHVSVSLQDDHCQAFEGYWVVE